MSHIGLWSGSAFDSFHGVSFGDSYNDVQTLLPGAEPQTSPYGAQALLMLNVIDKGVHYDRVVYEFTYRGGMQLVMARFSPESTTALYHTLIGELGPPADGGARAAAAPAKANLSWQLRDGENILFDGPGRWLILLGPGGTPLKQDVELRKQSSLYGA